MMKQGFVVASVALTRYQVDQKIVDAVVVIEIVGQLLHVASMRFLEVPVNQIPARLWGRPASKPMRSIWQHCDVNRHHLLV